MSFRAGVLSGVRVTHDAASVEQIAAASGDDEPSAVEELLTHDAVSEAFVLQTCNRAEAYVVADDANVGRAVLEAWVADVSSDVATFTGHEASLRHLLRVASGLESLVLGEDQIIGQVRTAYEAARGVGGIGPILEDAVTKAIHVGERARTETGINEGVVSLGSAAAELASREGVLDGATALVVGAGEMARLSAKALAANGATRVVVANRTVPHAEHLAEQVAADAQAVALPAVPSALADADVVVTATGAPDHVVEPETVAGAGETTIVDIAQPRDVDPAVAEHPTVALYDLDDLESIAEGTRASRQAAAENVEAMVERELGHLLEQFKRKRADAVIAAMYESAEHVKRRETQRALSQLAATTDGEVTDEQREVVESMADALVGQLLAAPTRSLRDAAAEDDWETIHAALELFDPEFADDASEGPPAGVAAMLEAAKAPTDD
jgi:glutamyl-tRNA reductase